MADKHKFTKRHQDILTSKEAIDELLNQYALNEKFTQAQLMVYWEEWMGKAIATRTTKLFIKKNKLYVQLASAALKHTLSLSKDAMIAKINSYFSTPLIEDVFFL